METRIIYDKLSGIYYQDNGYGAYKIDGKTAHDLINDYVLDCNYAVSSFDNGNTKIWIIADRL